MKDDYCTNEDHGLYNKTKKRATTYKKLATSKSLTSDCPTYDSRSRGSSNILFKTKSLTVYEATCETYLVVRLYMAHILRIAMIEFTVS